MPNQHQPDLKPRAGFTLMEVIITITVIVIVAAIAAPSVSRSLGSSYLNTSTSKVARTLRKAQTYSLNGKEGSVWGVHYEPRLLVLFRGDSYAGRDPSFDEKFNLPQAVTVSGLGDVWFKKLRGDPSTTVTITVSSLGNQRMITVNQEGMIDVQ